MVVWVGKSCELMHYAIVKIRLLGWVGKAEQAAAAYRIELKGESLPQRQNPPADNPIFRS